MSRFYRIGRRSPAVVGPGAVGAEEVPVQLDLLRAELYRVLDELARSSAVDRRRLLVEYERSWARFKDALDRPARRPHR